ncbi:LytR family transcriptional regulator [Rossellomorea vietnamensis]|uniref:LytR family transcriptional regulator n=1 Tax=Rossellomorea vietnamensis TaxID=218284 RepID=UPI003D2D943D
MILLDEQPKSIKKAIRYIKQDASKEQLKEIRKLLDYAIYKRLKVLDPRNCKAMKEGKEA